MVVLAIMDTIGQVPCSTARDCSALVSFQGLKRVLRVVTVLTVWGREFGIPADGLPVLRQAASLQGRMMLLVDVLYTL